MPLGRKEIEHRFSHHAPDAEKAAKHEALRDKCKTLANYLDKVLPDGREKASAITHLEQVMFWGNAGIARPSSALGVDPAAPKKPTEGKVDGRSKEARAARAAEAAGAPTLTDVSADKPVRKVTRTRKAS